MSIQRYADDYGSMYKSPDGEWCWGEDVAALERENEKLRACRDELREATAAIRDPAVNLATTLPDAIRSLERKYAVARALLAMASEVLALHPYGEDGSTVSEKRRRDVYDRIIAELGEEQENT